MSHVPLRKEKDCLNCGTIVQGRYCHVCGQENIVPKETFWHMVTHFFYDITHFDSSFFHTVHQLIFRPGFLSKEYMNGRRVKYLHPIRMYVFTSAVFFLLFLSVFKPVTVGYSLDTPVEGEERTNYVKALQHRIEKDSLNPDLLAKLAKALDTSRALTVRDTMTFDEKRTIIQFTGTNYRTQEAYDSAQRSLPSSERDGWLTRKLVKRQIEINIKFRERPDEAFDKFTKTLLHRLPYMLFVSLPLFALILQLVYIRRKQFYYADHGVFTIHLYIFTFIILMVVIALDKLDDLFGRDLFTWIYVGLFLASYLYLYKAMRRFYGQGRAKTIVKFVLVSFLSFVMMALLLVVFVLFSGLTF